MELTNLETYMKEFTDVQKAYQEAKSKIGEQLGAELHGMVKTVFEKVPQLKKISWTQYTPYFNDGDPCVFSKHDPQFLFESTDGDEIEFEFWDYGGDSTTIFKYDEDEKKTLQITQEQDELLLKVARFLDKLDQDICEEAFGEGKIVINVDELEVEEYDHD